MTKSTRVFVKQFMNGRSAVCGAALASMLVVSAGSTHAQNMPPELSRSKSRSVDPSLPDELRSAVERASAAELDKKRGPGNALQILRAERAKWKDVPSTLLSLEFRIAAIVLRTRFLQNKKTSIPIRYQQALSTYSKLDLTEPGLLPWIKRALDKHPDVKKKYYGKTKKSRLPIAVLTRGSGLNSKKIFAQMKPMLSKVGVNAKLVKVKKARYLLKFGSDEVRDSKGGTLVRVTLNIESRLKNKMVWQKSFYRTSKSRQLDDAIADNVNWLLRMGGRDVLFNWLRFHGLEDTAFSIGGGGHDHGSHGSHGKEQKSKFRGKSKHEPTPPRLRRGGDGHNH